MSFWPIKTVGDYMSYIIKENGVSRFSSKDLVAWISYLVFPRRMKLCRRREDALTKVTGEGEEAFKIKIKNAYNEHLLLAFTTKHYNPFISCCHHVTSSSCWRCILNKSKVWNLNGDTCNAYTKLKIRCWYWEILIGASIFIADQWFKPKLILPVLFSSAIHLYQD